MGELRIRVGLHAGKAEWIARAEHQGSDHFGPSVNCAARAMSAAASSPPAAHSSHQALILAMTLRLAMVTRQLERHLELEWPQQSIIHCTQLRIDRQLPWAQLQ
jgi:class 3 adenylate cyclase